MSLKNKLMPMVNALTGITGLKVYHYMRPKLSAPYCIWQEDSEYSALLNDNHKGEQSIAGTIDYYTRVEFDDTIDTIQAELNKVENLYWELSSVQFEDDTNLIHYEWLFRVL